MTNYSPFVMMRGPTLTACDRSRAARYNTRGCANLPMHQARLDWPRTSRFLPRFDRRSARREPHLGSSAHRTDRDVDVAGQVSNTWDLIGLLQDLVELTIGVREFRIDVTQCPGRLRHPMVSLTLLQCQPCPCTCQSRTTPGVVPKAVALRPLRERETRQTWRALRKLAGSGDVAVRVGGCSETTRPPESSGVCGHAPAGVPVLVEPPFIHVRSP